MTDVDISEIPIYFLHHCRRKYPSNWFPSGFPRGHWDDFAISQFCNDRNANYTELRAYAFSSGDIPPPQSVIKELGIKVRDIRGTRYSMDRFLAQYKNNAYNHK